MAEVGFVPMEKELGTRLLVLRGDRSQEEVAVGVGVRRETIKQWENAERHIKAVDLVKLARYYDVSVDYLLGLSDRKALDADTQTVQYTLDISNEAVANMLGVSSPHVNASRGMDALLSHKNMKKLMRSVQDVLSKVDYVLTQMAASPTASSGRSRESLVNLVEGKQYVAAKTFEAILEDLVNVELSKPTATTEEADNAEEK